MYFILNIYLFFARYKLLAKLALPQRGRAYYAAAEVRAISASAFWQP